MGISLKNLPHRYPFLMVDKIIEEDGAMIGIKNVTVNEWWFASKTEGDYVMPNIMILETMAQVAGLLTFVDEAEATSEKAVLLVEVRKFEFKHKVFAGDTIKVSTSTLWCREQTASVHVRAMAEGNVVAEGQLIIKNNAGGKNNESGN